MKLSIIVPVFNLERLLPKCIDSILAQTFKDFELILVNDGSTDKSDEICDEYGNKDQRIIVIHKKNGGVSSARNAGLAVARGEYIGFVDSDDYVNKHMYETLCHTAIQNNADITVCSFLNVCEDQGQAIDKPDLNYKTQHFNNREAIRQMYISKSNYITYIVPWNKLYKRQLFNDIQYKVGNIYDDETIAHMLLYNSKNITYINSKLYYYVQRSGSQMNSPFHIKRFDKIYALNERAKYFKQYKETDLYEKALKHFMDMFFWYYYLAKDNLKSIDKELKTVKRTFDNSLLDLLKHKKIGWKQKLMCILFSVNPYLFELLKTNETKRKRRHYRA